MLTFSRFVPAPENRSALMALDHLATCLCSGLHQRLIAPLFVHGPPGTGKTHLMTALAEAVARRGSARTITLLGAADFQQQASDQETHPLLDCKQCDLLIIEDLQMLRVSENAATSVFEALVEVLDYRHARQQPSVLTANAGPAEIRHFPPRLVSRLAAGLVVRIEPLQYASRLLFLQEMAQRRQLAARSEVLDWLARNLTGGGRQLEGALNQLAVLSSMQQRLPDIADIEIHFREQASAARPTVERIAERVGHCYRIQARHLQSRRRYQSVLLPRQVGMYLARQLTDLSLQEIGRFFGGRDHSTVLHACRKIERQLEADVSLSGTVNQLRADLK